MSSKKRHKGTETQRHKGLLIILSSASGAGKTTIAKKLIQKDPRFVLSISYTTRPPRGEEKEGKDYFFVDEDKFEQMVEERKFLEWEKVHDAFYGTSRDFVQKNLSSGKDVVLVIDVKGGKHVGEKCPDSISIFFLAPSFEELKKRLQNRCTESEEEIEKRIESADWEEKQAEDYDYHVVNDKLEDAVEKTLSIIKTEHAKRR
jgi:guanylate kinase